MGRVPFVGAVAAPSAWAARSPGNVAELAPAWATAIVPGLSAGAVDAIRLAVALLLLAAGSALHLWSKGCLEQNQRLVTAGPYRFTRNPFYLANLLVDLALCALIGRVWVALPYLLLWWLAYRETIAREEERLAALFPAEVARYFAAVPRLIPNGRTLPRAESVGRFTFGNPALSQGSEYARLLGFQVAAATIAAAAWLRGMGLTAFSDEHAVGLALVLLVPVAWVAKLALAEVCRRPETVLMPRSVGGGATGSPAVRWSPSSGLLLSGLLVFAAGLAVRAGEPWLADPPLLGTALLMLDAYGDRRLRDRRLVGHAEGDGPRVWSGLRPVTVAVAISVGMIALARHLT